MNSLLSLLDVCFTFAMQCDPICFYGFFHHKRWCYGGNISFAKLYLMPSIVLVEVLITIFDSNSIGGFYIIIITI